MSQPTQGDWQPGGSGGTQGPAELSTVYGPPTAYPTAPAPGANDFGGFGSVSTPPPVEALPVEGGSGRTWTTLAGVGVAALLVGAVLGVVASDPTGSSEYQELLAVRDDLQRTNEQLAEDLAAMTSERDEAIADYDAAVADYEAAVAGADEREGELDERETQLDQRSGDLDERSAELDAREEALDEREADIVKLETYLDENSFGSGTLLVGEQINPGTYSAPGGSNCYWERLSGTSGEFGDIISNEWEPNNSQVLVTIRSSDVAFSSSGCGTWTRVP